MADNKLVAASIIKFLKQQLDSSTLNADLKESLEVGVQCLETAFEVTPEETAKGLDLVKLVQDHLGKSEPSPEARAEAEKLKNEGNELMKSEKHKEALEKYSKAILIDPKNAVYFCNRAAAYFKLEDFEAAVADCTAALAIQPDYSKAYGRLGLALTSLNKHREARAAYARASQLDPENDSYKTNLRLAEERLSQQGERPNLDLGGLLQNPALINMATEMLADPHMQNLISGLMTNTTGGPVPNGGGMNALLEAGQALAQHMQSSNPELVDQLRRQMGNQPPGGQPPQ